MNEPWDPPNVPPAVPSLDTDRSAGAAGECARVSMIFAAVSPAGESTSRVRLMPLSVLVAIAPPAPAIKALIQTT
jgi:hypothetical protein